MPQTVFPCLTSRDITVTDPATKQRVTLDGVFGMNFLVASAHVTEGLMPDIGKLTEGPFDVPSSWTPDGKELLFTRGYTSLGGNTDVYAVSIDAPGKVRPVLATPADPAAHRDGLPRMLHAQLAASVGAHGLGHGASTFRSSSR